MFLIQWAYKYRNLLDIKDVNIRYFQVWEKDQMNFINSE